MSHEKLPDLFEELTDNFSSDAKSGTQSQGNALLQAALGYAKRGWAVLPVFESTSDGKCACGDPGCKNVGKHPRTTHGYKDASTDPNTIQKWWKDWPFANIGIAGGKTSGIVVLDVDPKHGGEHTLAALEGQFGKLPDTVYAISGSGGRHFLFKAPDRPTRTRTPFRPGLDFISDKLYIVAPPSLHHTGKRYQWEVSSGPDQVPLAEAPAWLIEVSQEQPKNDQKKSKTGGDSIPEGKRNDTLTQYAGRMRRQGFDYEPILAAIYTINIRRCQPPLSEDEVAKIAESVSKYAPHEVPPGLGDSQDDWEEIRPFDEYVLPELHAQLFTSWFGAFTSALALATETPLELPGLMGLAVVSTAVGGKFKIQVKPGYEEPIHIWVCPALESGNRKTSVFEKCIKPLLAYRQKVSAELKRKIDSATSMRESQMAIINAKRKELPKLGSAQQQKVIEEIAELETKLPEIPKIPMLFGSDTTPESLAVGLAENRERFALLSEEGGTFQTMAGRYSNGIPNLDIYLQGHSGEAPVGVTRISRNMPPLTAPALTIGISPQPYVIHSLKDHPSFREQGLWARFLFALPKSKLGYRTGEGPPIPDEVRERYHEGVTRLLEIETYDAVNGVNDPIILTVCPEALESWKEFSRQTEKELRLGERLYLIKEWAGKRAGAAARIAGLFHLIEYAHSNSIPKEVSEQTMKRAIRFVDALTYHALAAMAQAEIDQDLVKAKAVIRWLTDSKRQSFSLRDCQSKHHRLLSTAKETSRILGILVEHNYIREVPSLSRSSTGRRPGPRYEVNPALFEEG